MIVKVLERPRIDRRTIANARTLAPVGKRSGPGRAHETQKVLFGIKEDDAAQETFRLQQEFQISFDNHTQSALAADEEIDQIHFRGDEVTGRVLADVRHLVRRQLSFDHLSGR